MSDSRVIFQNYAGSLGLAARRRRLREATRP